MLQASLLFCALVGSIAAADVPRPLERQARFDFETATFTPEDISVDDDSARLDEFDELCDRVLEVVRRYPGISGRRVRIEVGANAQAVYAALEKLEANGAVRNTAKRGTGAKWTAVTRVVEPENQDQ